MVHGDGQYAPEELPNLVAPLRDGRADAVFGSRMMTRLGAIKGGMPLYKFVGNRILSRVQNLLLGTNLTEFHSGYRVYSVAALTKIRFRLNSNEFHFDTEIIIQLLNAGQRIVELPIPTYYGDEICRVNGMKYAKDVVLATLRNVAHRAGLLYQRRFEPVGDEDNAHYDLKLGYASSHQFALDAVPPGAAVLDIGAGPGGIARELVKKGCRVAVVDQFVPKDALDSDVIVFSQDLDEEPTFDVRGYEYLLLLDVIEHLKNPERFLERLRAQFDYSPRTLDPDHAQHRVRRAAGDARCSGSSTTARPASSTGRTRACSPSDRCAGCSSTPASGSRRSAACRRRFRRCWATACWEGRRSRSTSC